MQALKFKRWIGGVRLLSEGQRRQFLERLLPALGLDRLRASVRGEERLRHCPSPYSLT